MYYYVFRYHHFSLRSHQISWWNDHSSPLNSCQKNTIHSFADYLRHQTGILQIPKWIQMVQVCKKYWNYGFSRGQPTLFYGSTEGLFRSQRPPPDPDFWEFAVLLGEAEALHLRSQAIEDGVGDHLAGTAPVHVTPGAVATPTVGTDPIFKTIKGGNGEFWVEWMSQWGREVFFKCLFED